VLVPLALHLMVRCLPTQLRVYAADHETQTVN
jgi:hypothetical protein